jgi:hypothetical protein
MESHYDIAVKPGVASGRGSMTLVEVPPFPIKVYNCMAIILVDRNRLYR